MKFLLLSLFALVCTGLQASTTKLTQSVALPLVVDGKTVGSMKLPAGSEVEVVSITDTNAVIRRGDSTYTITSSSLQQPTTLSAATTETISHASAPVVQNQQGKLIDKTLNESRQVAFFVPHGEHTPSVIDASRLNAPTPQGGWLTVKDGHLYQGNKRVRIAGINADNNVTDNDIAEMKKYGFNGVRLWVADICAKKYGDPLKNYFDGNKILPENLDRLDEIIGRFINAGFWVDLNITAAPQKSQADDTERELTKKFISVLFNHVNPYTNRAYGKEPAIFSVEIANEFGIHNRLCHNDGSSYRFDPLPYQKQITAKWNKWLSDKYKTQSELDAAWKDNRETLGSISWMLPPVTGKYPPQKNTDWYLFTVNLENDYSQDLVSFLHSNLNYNGVIITGCATIKPETWNIGDAIMQHMYPGMGDSKMVTSCANRAYARVYGKPFLVTECNILPPNPYLGEVGLSALATATAQDWDGVFFFSWISEFSRQIHSAIQGPENMIKGEGPVRDNPALLVSLPTAINLFLRGDIAPIKNKVQSSPRLEGNGHLFDHQVGATAPVQDSQTFGEQGSFSFDGTTISVVSPKTLISIGACTNQLGAAHFEIGKTQLNWAGVSITSLNNDLPIKDANKILVTLIGKTGNTGSYMAPGMGGEVVTKQSEGGEETKLTKEQYLRAWGTAPVVTECISANVFIPVDTSKGAFKAYSLDEKAQRKKSIPLEVTPEGITLHTTGKEGTVWYEISRS